MNKPNIVDNAEQKRRKSHWPAYLPYPSCWLKSFILMVFLRVIGFVTEILIKLGDGVANLVSSPELLAIFVIITLLSPIAVIAFTHHYLHLFFSRFISEIQAPEIGIVTGIIPKLMSWWEGLYGWLVIILSTLVTCLVCTIILPMFHLSYIKPPETYTQFEQQIIVIFGIIWLIQGALIYQIDYLVKQRLISVYSGKIKL
ncbi:MULTISPECIES: hypothetical protein [Nostoc]|uniref:Uncharacterized protein n=2 Tax=Nostoc TaxID=1177 RepID=A0ABR8IIN5_9NOSO|nr:MULTISPECIES: hypothetical protein [Nostoc]MBD2563942.1 hypothetical protein [Nostoc linckia FACHB-391]MBD2650841.1 hypothetical protein [Nostoc foliaceum FACHB-393]